MAELLPSNLRKPSYKQFAFRGEKENIFRKTQIGDCGVYSLKFVECMMDSAYFVGRNKILGGWL